MKTIEEYNQDILQNPNSAELHYYRGVAYYTEGSNNWAIANHLQANASYTKAIADLSKAIELAPNAKQPYNYRGMLYYNMGDDDKAIADFSKLIDELKSNDADVFYFRGLVYLTSKKDTKQAIEDFNKALKINPDCTNAYRKLGDAYFSMGDNDKAIENFIEVIKREPNAQAFFSLGNAYYARGKAKNVKEDNALSIDNFNKALELNNEFALAYLNRGQAYGNSEQAIEDFQKALSLSLPNEFIEIAKGLLETTQNIVIAHNKLR